MMHNIEQKMGIMAEFMKSLEEKENMSNKENVTQEQMNEYVIKDPNIGIKFDQGKEPLDLIPYEALREIAIVLGKGAERYQPFNWCSGISYRRLLSATERHIGKYKSGEDIDPDFKTNHLANAACNLLFILYYEAHKKYYEQFDDRGFKKLRVQRENK